MNTPNNFVAVAGANITLRCTVNHTDGAIWSLVRSSDTRPVIIFINAMIVFNLTSEYRINNGERGQYDLVIDSADIKHAGRYSCKSFNTAVESATYLTVIGEYFFF